MIGVGYLTLAQIRQLTGLTDRQIRYYDTKGLVVPVRTPGGHRLYSPEQVDQLVLVKRLLAEGRSVRDVLEELHRPPTPHAESSPLVLPLDVGAQYQAFDDRGLEDVKIYFHRPTGRPGNDS